MLLSFQEGSLQDYEENGPSHLYCTLIIRNNSIVVLQVSFKISKKAFDNCCKGPPTIISRVVVVSGKY